jgi:hypothetical protein
MKTLFLPLVTVIALTFTLASCRKDRTCTCTYSDGTSDKTEYKKVTKKFVREDEECFSVTFTETGKSPQTRTCTID